MKGRLWYFDLSFACGGVVEYNDFITETPPILKKFRGQPLLNLRRWVETNGGTLTEIKKKNNTMKKKFLRKNLNICTSCFGHGTKVSDRKSVFLNDPNKGKRKNIYRLCPDCYGSGMTTLKK